MDRRRFLFASLAGALGSALAAGAASAASRATLPEIPAPEAPQAEPAILTEAEMEELLTEAQWGPPPGRPRGRGRRRCWVERRRIRYRDRFGYIRVRWVDQRVCR
ncbi:hypothetical protein [Falsiroseomonas tokyonensis]|uniref:Uncharacterized protein n=1 Tax=Falsiroseomonas tokyonensis TaxID=430521 RepID=A0ABV7BVJ4_9PROT|nr:hypothetical protein [Falsiroseomonas tokyonensis]MBU8539693.1 hypothetical protein [Falsiroseomonas tokyonensis]